MAKLEPEKFEINDYLNHTYECECGREHLTPLKEVVTCEHAIKKVPGLVGKYGHSRPLVVCDHNTYDAAAAELCSELESAGIEYDLLVFEGDVVPAEPAIGELALNVKADTDLIIAVGTGSINDVCKYVSWVAKIEYFIVGTAPSMDGFASVGASIIYRGLKNSSFATHSAQVIIGDTTVLAKAPMDLIAAGIGDLLGKYTCLCDWKISHLINDEYYCPRIVRMVERSVAEVVESAPLVESRDPEVMGKIMNALVLAGIAMYYCGNSRPAAGCEHNFSHFLEMRYLFDGRKAVYHGRKVAIGAVTCAYLYHKLANETPDFDRARAMRSEFDFDAWAERMRVDYRLAADGVIQLQEKSHNNDPSKVLPRIDALESHWSEVCEIIKADIPPYERIAGIIESLGAPTKPAGVGIDRELYKTAMLDAKEIRDRYTLFQMLYDLGMLDEYVEDAAKKFCD